MNDIITEYSNYFTATNLEWKHLLKPDKYKNIIIDSLRFLVEDKRIKLFAFVIMSNHIHLIWQMLALLDPKAVQRDFLKFTAQKIKADLKKNHPDVLEYFRVDAKDREYPRLTAPSRSFSGARPDGQEFWERNPLSVELRNHNIFLQKLDYIHWNPVRVNYVSGLRITCIPLQSFMKPGLITCLPAGRLGISDAL